MENCADEFVNLPASWQSLQNCACDLDTVAGLYVSGRDAVEYLHNLSSCNMLSLTENFSVKGSFCNRQGRTISTFDAFLYQQGVLLLLPTANIQPLIDKISIYILRADVQLEPLPVEALKATGFIGEQSVKWIFTQLAVPNGNEIQLYKTNDYILLNPTARKPVTHGSMRCMVLAVNRTNTSLLKEAAAAGIHICAPNAWEYADIRDCLVHTNLWSSERYVPQMLNLDALRAISFSKGCYPGQEVISRLHNLGKVKKRTYPFYAHTSRQVMISAEVSDKSGSVCGEVITVCQLGDAEWTGLAVLQLAKLQTSLYIYKNIQVQRMPLPYYIDENSQDAERQG